EERKHIDEDACPRCAGLVAAFTRKRAATAGRWKVVLSVTLRLAFVVGIVLLPVINWLVAQGLTSTSISDLSWWEEAQRRFLRLDLGVIGVLALLSPLLRLLGWMGRLRDTLPLTLLGLGAISA